MHLEIKERMHHRPGGRAKEGKAHIGMARLLGLQRPDKHPDKPIDPGQGEQAESDEAMVGNQFKIFIVRMAGDGSLSFKAFPVRWIGVAIVSRSIAKQRGILDQIDRIHPGLRPEIVRLASNPLRGLALQKGDHRLHAPLEGFRIPPRPKQKKDRTQRHENRQKKKQPLAFAECHQAKHHPRCRNAAQPTGTGFGQEQRRKENQKAVSRKNLQIDARLRDEQKRQAEWQQHLHQMRKMVRANVGRHQPAFINRVALRPQHLLRAFEMDDYPIECRQHHHKDQCA